MNPIPRYLPALARLPIGLSLLGHGLVRLAKLSAFSQGMVSSFEPSFLPQSLVSAFGYILPFLEFAIGLFLIVGLFTRQALVVGIVIMAILIFGSSTIENWNAITAQLIHTGYLVALFFIIDENPFSIDHLLKR